MRRVGENCTVRSFVTCTPHQMLLHPSFLPYCLFSSTVLSHARCIFLLYYLPLVYTCSPSALVNHSQHLSHISALFLLLRHMFDPFLWDAPATPTSPPPSVYATKSPNIIFVQNTGDNMSETCTTHEKMTNAFKMLVMKAERRDHVCIEGRIILKCRVWECALDLSGSG